MTPAMSAALRAWETYRWTNALVAVTAGGEGVAQDNPQHAPLCGLTFSVKDVFAVAGLRSAAGSLLLKDYVPGTSAPVVTRLAHAGAQVFAKANCAEFGVGTDTETRLGGRVLHPFDPEVSPGGSSGGDAVAVAANIVDFAVGADYGGSVRWPAQCVGVYGLRTSAGLVPRTGRIPGTGATRHDPAPGPPAPGTLLGELEVVGFLARHPSVLASVVSAAAGTDGADWAGKEVGLAQRPARRRLALTTGQEVAPVSGSVLAALRSAATAAKGAGWEVLDADGVLAGACEAYTELRAALDDHTDLRRLVVGYEELLCAGTRELVEATAPPALAARLGRGTDACERVERARSRARAVVERALRLLDDVDALLVPVAPVPAVAFGGGAEVGGRWLQGPDLMAHCRAVSLTGFPSLSMPVCRDGDGRPVSVQVVGAPGADLTCCQIAAELCAS